MYGYRGIPYFFRTSLNITAERVKKAAFFKCKTQLWKPAGIIFKHAPERRQMSDSFLELRNLKKFYIKEYVLQGINLQIDQGEFVTLLGASGCGKTTTLRIIAGLEQPDSGSVWLKGKDVTNLEPNQRDVNTVFQNYALFPHMNVADNIGYGLKIRKVPKADIKKKVKEMLELVQLEGFEKRNCGALRWTEDSV